MATGSMTRRKTKHISSHPNAYISQNYWQIPTLLHNVSGQRVYFFYFKFRIAMEQRRKCSTLVLLYFALFSVKLCVKLRFFNGEPHTLIVFCARQREIWKTLLVGLSHIDAAHLDKHWNIKLDLDLHWYVKLCSGRHNSSQVRLGNIKNFLCAFGIDLNNKMFVSVNDQFSSLFCISVHL